MIVVSGVECAITDPMVSTLKCDHARPARRQHRRFHRCLARLKPRVAKDGLPGLSLCAPPSLERDAAQLACQLTLEPVGMDIPHGMKQPGHLLLPRLDDSRVRMTGCRHAKRRRE